LLKHGAAQVYAVDVGVAQLHESLRKDVRVKNLERTHIAKLSQVNGFLLPPPSIATIDVSFISLTTVLPETLKHLTTKAFLYVLVKPQFEVGKDLVGKGGIVRDTNARRAALEKILMCARELGLQIVGHMESPIRGSEGNVEYLAHFKR
jgi:23S rRNA (cytidine1920-2'-O)/16S rRNA (cytidine1409-2'-O)-methyltransferase